MRRPSLTALAALLAILAGLVGDVAGGSPATAGGRSAGAVLQQTGGVLEPGPESQGLAELFGQRAATLDEAELARRNGDHDGAAAILRLLAGGTGPEATEALLQLGVVLIEGGREGDAGPAADAARELLGRRPEPRTRALAWTTLGRAQRAGGDCAGALASFAEAQRVGSGLRPHIDLLMAECHAKLGDRIGQDDRARQALAATLPRLARVDALEHRVDAAQKRGDRPGALLVFQELLPQAGTRAYRAKTMTNIGTLEAESGRRDLAARTYATVVAELPETPTAPAALQGLVTLDAVGAVGPDAVGLVHHFAGRHAQAVTWLGTALDGGLPPERAARALYHRGSSLIRLERLDEGVAALRRLALEHPEAELAPQALLRAGRALESAGRLAEAEEIFRQAAEAAPAAQSGHDARARLAITLYRRGALPEAVAAGRELLTGAASSQAKGLGLLWAGKAFARADDPAQAEGAWLRAADLDPDNFGGLRARALRDGDARARNIARSLDPAALRVTDAERAEVQTWLARWSIGEATLERERLGDDGYARAAELFRVGLREQARWEIQEIGARLSGDPARLYWLGRFAAEQGEPQLGIRYAVEARRATDEPLSAQPRLLQRLMLPLPYADIILAHTAQRGIDPLLFAALVRQESTFSAEARSSANALGLAQVIPSTGRGIAQALGRPDFRNDDLLRPIVSVEFGVYYLASQLKAYDGLIYPALAAYNAGGGAVNGWLREYGSEDVDVFAERIPYPETNHYVQVVYENYRLYRRLYGG